jgi:tight adherence protein B
MMLVLLFAALFATVVILLYLFAGGESAEAQQTIARLEAIGLGPHSPGGDEDALAVRRDETLSEIEWLDRLLHRLDVARTLQLWLTQAEMKWTAGRLITLALLMGLVCGYLVFIRTGSLFLSLLLSAGAGALPFFHVLRKRRQRFERMKERLPEALDLMVSAIRAGQTFTSAMGMASRESAEPVKREFRYCFDEQNYGLDLRVAMTNLVYRVPIREMRMIATSVLIQKETGGNLTEILEKVAMLIREDYRLQRQVRVHTAQGRMTGWILSLLPVFLGIGLYLVNPENMSILWTKPIGLKMLQGSIVMTFIGVLIIRKIVRVEI